MTKVNIEVDSKYDQPQTYEKVKGLFGPDSEVSRFDPSVTCDFDENSHSCKAKGSKFSATVNVEPKGDTSSVLVVVDLPMLLGAFKGQVKSAVEKKLNSLLT